MISSNGIAFVSLLLLRIRRYCAAVSLSPGRSAWEASC